MGDSSGFRSGKAGILPLLAAALLLSACTNNAYMGIPLTEGVGDPTLRSLAQRASAGDKQAQLDLGIRYEEGRGVEPNVAKAKRLYHLASSESGGAMWVYSPPVGNGTKGQVIPVNRGPRLVGLVEAKVKLDALREKTK